MNWLQLVIGISILLLGTTSLCGQNTESDYSAEILELWLNDEETDSEAMMEELEELKMSPINLNDTSSSALLLLPFINERHLELLKAYIEQNGELLSVDELHLINGFDACMIQWMTPYVQVSPIEEISPSLKEMLRRANSTVLIGTRQILPLSAGYSDSTYPGTAFRMYYKINVQCTEHLSLTLSGDKDPGERFTGDGIIPGFDHYGFNLTIANQGIVKKAIVGQYQLQFGQGLSLWSGFAPRAIAGANNRRYGAGIRAASAFCEYGYLQGGASTLTLSAHTDITLFYSYRKHDATTAQSADSTQRTITRSISLSGYHRTDSEMAKKDILGEHFFGTHLNYHLQRLSIGASLSSRILDQPIKPKANAYNAYAFAGRHSYVAGIDFSYTYHGINMFGESAVAINDSTMSYCKRNDWLPVATIIGVWIPIHSDHIVSVTYHNGTPIFYNFYSRGIGQNTSEQNQSGWIFALSSALPYHFSLDANAELFNKSYLSYRTYSPQHGADYRLRMQRAIGKHILLSIVYRNKSALRNNNTQLYQTERTRRQQTYIHFDYQPSEKWHIQSKIGLSHFACDEHESQKGMFANQTIGYQTGTEHHRLTLRIGTTLYNITHYDARIYLYENDLKFDYSSSMLNGKGMRLYLIYRQQLGRRLSIGAKYAYAYYPDRETVGSGPDATEGNCRHEWKIQLQWRPNHSTKRLQ